MDGNAVPLTMTVGGRKWTPDTAYDWETEFGWKTPFRDDEYDFDPDEVSATAKGGEDVPHYFVYMVKNSDGTFRAEILGTCNPDYNPNHAEPLGGDDERTADSLDEILNDVRELMERVA